MIIWEFEEPIITSKLSKNSTPTIQMVEDEACNLSMSVGICPSCGYTTNPIFNVKGARVTVEYHMKQVHKCRS